ncbi:hypothetical protein MXD59_13160 [Frankia sp. Ag45/Mut15]|uniref:Polyketide cyclase/dehydrase n=1 Tax=Frankia umida TaxID=573489 RepID=A0ABT0JZ32_9ACTN|nr:hypothetical protein [Frankia umida]MCK9876715.1 hypothetical protein [Frankia umida]
MVEEPGLTPPFDRLPFIDEHMSHVSAPAEAVWAVLTRTVQTRLRIRAPMARLLGSEPSRASGTLPEPGSAVPGWTVADAVAGHRLVLTGRHRFSRYALIFVLEDAPGGSTLRVRTLAEFPGPGGRIYRTLVIGSGGHRRVVGGLVRSLAAKAASPSAAGR